MIQLKKTKLLENFVCYRSIELLAYKILYFIINEHRRNIQRQNLQKIMNSFYKIKNYQLCTDIQSEQQTHHNVPVSHTPRFINQIMIKNQNFCRKQLKKKSILKPDHESKYVASTKKCFNIYKSKNRNKQKENKQEQNKQIEDGYHLLSKTTFLHGNKIEGTWKNGSLHGNVAIYYQTGQFFSGTYANGIRIKGKVKFKDGTEYTGGFYKDIFHGEGSLKDHTGRIIKCEWKQGQPGRKARIQYPSGDIYIGQIFNLKKHGSGHLFFKNGNKYIGKFVNGEITGQGSYYENDKKIAEGIWLNGVLQVEQNVRQIIFQSLKHQKIIDLQLQEEGNQLKTINQEVVSLAKTHWDILSDSIQNENYNYD